MKRSWGRSLEVLLYFLVVAFALWRFYIKGYEISRTFDKGGVHSGRLRGLSSGWIPGWRLDSSDIQWREFRGSLPALSGVLGLFAASSRLMQTTSPNYHIHCSVWISLVFVGYLHGSYTIHVLFVLFLNYTASRITAGSTAGPIITWTLNPVLLILAKLTDGFPFSMFSDRLVWLDQLKGPLRWHIVLNLNLLRLISYAMDHHWSKSRRHPIAVSAPNVKATLDQHARVKARSAAVLPLDCYGPMEYLAYMLYPPLYVAGPISTFNNFIHQRHSKEIIPLRQVLIYGLRWFGAFLLLEILTHTVYANALTKYRMWNKFSIEGPMSLSVLGFWVLVFTWLKFLVIWRYFRFWSLIDNLEAPENMCRCLCNNYDIEGFWKNWHASYNLWLVRYMYIPMGGASTRLLNVWCIFTFVALWHDLEWKMLGWAWMMAAFLAPEMVVKWTIRQPQFLWLRKHWVYQHLCALSVSLNIGVLMTANMVGFVVGLDGVQDILLVLFGSIKFLVLALGVLFSAAHLMFEVRTVEQHTGRKLCPVL